MRNKFIAFLLCMGFLGVRAQGTASNETMASVMRANGKIYVVVAVLLTILLGLFGYLIKLDRKLSKLEKAS